jgi:hypothetical protein
MKALASFRPGAAQPQEAIARINAEVEHETALNLVHEKMIEQCWVQARKLEGDGQGYWLLLVRLTEAALLCAGNYADNCEYEAAGDFLVNPRQILVHRRVDGRTTAKTRHGRLSDQFGFEGIERGHFMKLFASGACLEITQPPLLPYMTQVLRNSECVSPTYLERLEDGQRRIADTLAFLAAWRISDSAELWRRLQTASAREREFVESNLCRFDTRVFHKIGVSLRRSLAETDYRSPFLAEPHLVENGLRRQSPATAKACAPSAA